MPNPIAGKMSQKMRFQLNNYYVTKTNYSRGQCKLKKQLSHCLKNGLFRKRVKGQIKKEKIEKKIKIGMRLLSNSNWFSGKPV
jgi:hypothetical protein